MAITGTEVEIMSGGIDGDTLGNGPYAQNVINYNNTWQTRKGFGTVGEWDSTLSRYTKDPGVLIGEEGYKTHLGSYLMTTDFGHRQIFSVFYMDAWNNQGIASNTALDSAFVNSVRNATYIISIYDITARERWEEVIYSQTSESAVPTPVRMPFLHGYYETNRYDDFAQIVKATDREQITFAEFNDTLFFGNGSTGLYFYKPAAFIGNTSKAIETIGPFAASKGYSESSMINRLRLAKGVHLAYVYLDFVPDLKGISSLGNRVVYFARSTLYFSDDNYPASVIATHSLAIPSELPITAVREINGNLLIFTDSETFLYQPNPSFFVNIGALTKLSETIGCLSANSILKYKNMMSWVDTNGIYSNAGGLKITEISEGIRPFFKSFLPNPLSHYHIRSGLTQLANEQPPIQYNLDPFNVTLSFSNRLKTLLVNVPNQRITLVLNENGAWSIWTYDSAAFSEAGVNKVGLRSFMDCQQILCDGDDIFTIGLDNREENKIKEDKASTWDRGTQAMVPDIDRTQRFNTYFICEYGRGGGCDRNIADEDYRYGIGEWTSDTTLAFGDPWNIGAGATDLSSSQYNFFNFIIGKPQKVEPGYVLNGSNKVMTNGGVLVPLQIMNFINYIPYSAWQLMGAAAIFEGVSGYPFISRTKSFPFWSSAGAWTSGYANKLKLEFEYDKDHWAPVLDTGTAKVNAIFKTPMENAQAGIGNCAVNFAMTADAECQLYNATTGALDAAGNLLKFAFDGNLAGTFAYTAGFGDLGQTYSMDHFPKPPWLFGGPSHGAAPQSTFDSPLPTPSDNVTTIAWIPFERINITESVSSMAIQNMKGAMTKDDGTNYWRSENYLWSFSSLGTSDSAHREDNVTQGVDWAYMSRPIMLDDGKQFKARGMYTQLKSHGMSEAPIDNGWVQTGVRSYRLYNSAVAADGTAWQGQIIDQPSPTGKPQAIAESDTLTETVFPPVTGMQENSVRVRIMDTTGVMKYKTFSNTSNTWGQQGTQLGTVLIDDSQFGEISQSNSTRGQWFNWLLFGYVLDKAEALFIKSGKAILRRVSGRRRRGHSGGNDA